MKTLKTLPRFFSPFLFLLLWVSVANAQWTTLNNAAPAGVGTSLLLTDGSVIVQEGSSSRWYRLRPDAFGSYVNGAWTQIASLPSDYGPLYYASAVLADGRVFVMGGEYNLGPQVWTNKGAIYDPIADTWTPLAAPSGWSNIGDAQCAVLPDGRLMLANPFDTRTAILDPATLTWSDGATGKTDRNDEEGWTLLRDGTLLTVDAINAPAAERFLPTLNTWISAGSTPQSLTEPVSQEIGPAVLLPNGTVFATGATGHTAIYTPGANLSDPGTWAAGPDFPIVGGRQLDIADGPACLLPSGNVLCCASPGIFQSPMSFFEFDGTNLNPVPATPNAPFLPSFVGTMLMLPTGQVFFTDFSGDVEVYTPTGAPNAAWRPSITHYPSTLAPGQTYAIQGEQFNGLSQCTGYGDDSTNATNYPLVRITDAATGHVFYCRTHDHSSMGVATGHLSVSTQFDVPAGIELGASTIEVVANGIPSVAQPVTVAAVTFDQIQIKRAGINAQVKFVIHNTTGQSATGVQLTGATLGGVASNQNLPRQMGTIPPGGSASVTLIFRVGPGTRVLSLSGTSSLGSFTLSQSVLVP